MHFMLFALLKIVPIFSVCILCFYANTKTSQLTSKRAERTFELQTIIKAVQKTKNINIF